MNEDALDNLLGMFENLGGEDVQLIAAPSEDVNLKLLLKDHIYGYLSKETLTDKEAALLAAMLQSTLLTPWQQ